MKKILLFTTIILLTSCGMKPVSIAPMEKTLDLEGNKNELYVRANNWIVETFDSGKAVVQFSDKESGTVSGKYMLTPTYGFNGYTVYQNGSINANINIRVKDNAARITVTPEDFREGAKFRKEDAINRVNALLGSFSNYMINVKDDF